MPTTTIPASKDSWTRLLNLSPGEGFIWQASGEVSIGGDDWRAYPEGAYDRGDGVIMSGSYTSAYEPANCVQTPSFNSLAADGQAVDSPYPMRPFCLVVVFRAETMGEPGRNVPDAYRPGRGAWNYINTTGATQVVWGQFNDALSLYYDNRGAFTVEMQTVDESLPAPTITATPFLPGNAPTVCLTLS